MRSIKNPHLAQLLLQLKFVSAAKRREYLDSAQTLFYNIDPQKKYPFDFVCFRITGYHPKDLPQELIEAKDLSEDLKIFIWKLSGKVDDFASDENEQVFTIQSLAKTIKVSSKTIERWRAKGLLARKYIFEDGKKRLGVSKSELERFLTLYPELVSTTVNLERVTDEEKSNILLMAREMAKNRKLSRRKVIKAIANEFGRGRETIRKILAEHDEGRQRGRIFKSSQKHLKSEQMKEIYKLYREGISVKGLSERFGRCRAEVYRIINQNRAKELHAAKIEFIASEEFFKENAFDIIAAKPLNKKQQKSIESDKLQLTSGSLNRYLQSIKNIERLTRDTELQLFRRFNYLKYLASIEQSRINLKKASGRQLSLIEKNLTEAENIKKRIIEANLGLVVSIASKHTLSGASLQELISEGNMALMRAAEKFDYSKGFRFATYVSWIITKDFARKIPEEARHDKVSAGELKNVQRDFRIAEAMDFGALDRARNSLVQVIKNELNEREQYVILRHYGLMSQTVIKTRKTLKEIGDELGLTRERVRQIELTALQKLKKSLSVEEFELLTG